MASDNKTLETALKRFKFGTSAESSQRQRELAGLKFFAGDQWPDYIKASRAGTQVQAAGGLETVGKKPCLTINKVKQPVQQIINQEKNANLGIQLRAEKDASVADAKVRQGLIRHIQAHSRGRIARSWAFDRAVQVGRGYYRIDKEYVHKTRKVLDADPASLRDQELVVNRILNQGNVLLDPFAKQPDWSDGNWAFIWDDMPFEEFKRKYKKSKTAAMVSDASSNDGELKAVAEQAPGWIGGDEEARTVRVAEYFYAEYSPVTVRVMIGPDGTSSLTDLPIDEWPTGATKGSGELEIEDRTISWCKLTAKEILEETEWEGSHIPIIPMVGNEFNLNGERLWNGEVEDAQDAQRLFNYTASAIALATAIAPLSQFILDPRQIEGFESYWKQANVRAFPYLPRHAFDERGQLYPDIHREGGETPIQALTMMLNQADSYLQATTSTPDPSLGRLDPKKASGKAIGLLQQQSDLANSNYIDNEAHVSLPLEGTILNEMLPFVYDRPGRIVEILGDDNKSARQVMVNAPFIQGPNGQPQPAPAPTNGQSDVQQYDLSKGTYSIIVDVVKSEPTQRTETRQSIIDMMGTSPQVSSALAPYLFQFSDQAGSEQITDTLKKLLWPPELNTPPGSVNWEQQAKQAAQQIQQLSGLLQQAQKVIETKQIETQADIQIATIKEQGATLRERIRAVSAGQVAETKVNADLAQTVFEEEVAAIGQRTDLVHTAMEAEKDREHDKTLAAHDAAVTERTQIREHDAAKEQATIQATAKSKEKDA